MEEEKGKYIMNSMAVQTIKTFGARPQIIEAVGELTKLSIELLAHVNGRKNKDSIIEEMADVIIMLDQLKIILDEYEIQKRLADSFTGGRDDGKR